MVFIRIRDEPTARVLWFLNKTALEVMFENAHMEEAEEEADEEIRSNRGLDVIPQKSL